MLLFSCRDKKKERRLSKQLEIFPISLVGITEIGERKSNTAVLVVHGYKTSLKKIIDIYQNINSKFIHADLDCYGFTWPSKNRYSRYFGDKITANRVSKTYLVESIRLLKLQGYKNICVVGHSMGTFISVESLYKKLMGSEVDVIISLAGDAGLNYFKLKRKYGRVNKKIVAFYNFYSRHDRVLRYISKTIHFMRRIGRNPLPKSAPVNYHDIDTRKLTGLKIRHKDYKYNSIIWEKIIKICEGK